MAPFFFPKSTKILQKSDPKRHSKIDRFLHRFFEGPRRPKSPQDGDSSAKTAPRAPQDGPKRDPENKHKPLVFGFGRQEASRPPPDPLRTPSGLYFKCQHASIFPLKIHQNPSKNRFQNASLFRSNSVSKTYQTHTSRTYSGGDIPMQDIKGSCAPQLGPSQGTNQLPIRPKNLKIRPPGYFCSSCVRF